MKITKIEKIGRHDVYDINVDDAHHYILENGVVTHNSGLKYSASGILMLGKSKDRDGVQSGPVVGNIVKAESKKSRYSKENQKIELRLDYKTGIDRYYGLVELAVKYNIWKKVANKIDVGLEKPVYEKRINKNPEKFYTEDVMKKLEEAALLEFGLGEGFENNDDDQEENDTEE